MCSRIRESEERLRAAKTASAAAHVLLTWHGPMTRGIEGAYSLFAFSQRQRGRCCNGAVRRRLLLVGFVLAVASLVGPLGKDLLLSQRIMVARAVEVDDLAGLRVLQHRTIPE